VDGRGVDQPDALLLDEGRKMFVHVVNQQVVAAVGKNGVNERLAGDVAKDFELEAGDADVTRLAALLGLAHGGNGFFDDLAAVAELNVVYLEEVDIVALEPAQRFIDARLDAAGRKIEAAGIITAALGRQQDLLAFSRQRRAKALFSESASVVGSDVEVIDSVVDGVTHGPLSFHGIDFSKLIAEGRRAKAEQGWLEGGAAEFAVSHRMAGWAGKGNARRC